MKINLKSVWPLKKPFQKLANKVGSWQKHKVKSSQPDSDRLSIVQVTEELSELFQTLSDRAVELHEQEQQAKQYLLDKSDFRLNQRGEWTLPDSLDSTVAFRQEQGEAGIIRDIHQKVAEERKKVDQLLEELANNKQDIRKAILSAKQPVDESLDDISEFSKSDLDAASLLAEYESLINGEEDNRSFTSEELKIMEKELFGDSSSVTSEELKVLKHELDGEEQESTVDFSAGDPVDELQESRLNTAQLTELLSNPNLGEIHSLVDLALDNVPQNAGLYPEIDPVLSAMLNDMTPADLQGYCMKLDDYLDDSDSFDAPTLDVLRNLRLMGEACLDSQNASFDVTDLNKREPEVPASRREKSGRGKGLLSP